MAAGTDNGVFCSFVDSLGTWKKLGTGLPAAVMVHDLQFNNADNLLIIGTFGRSTFTLSIPNGGGNVAPTIACPANITLTVASGVTSTKVIYAVSATALG